VPPAHGRPAQRERREHGDRQHGDRDDEADLDGGAGGLCSPSAPSQEATTRFLADLGAAATLAAAHEQRAKVRLPERQRFVGSAAPRHNTTRPAGRGRDAAVEDGEAWLVRYCIKLAADWTTRSARVVGQSAAVVREATLETDGDCRWRTNGVAAPALDGCLDVDLESSALTNAFRMHRLGLEIGEQAPAPGACVRALHLGVERLEQRYERLDNDGDRQR